MARSSEKINTVNTATGLLHEMRPWQWYKQGIMLLGIIFSRNLLNAVAWASLLLGIVAFTAAASAAYIFNDINDREADRNHPEKQHRPIASGQVSVSTATAFATLLVIVGLTAAYSLGPLFLLILLTYFAQNALYSLYLKEIVFVDILIVAVGFVLRAVAGVIAIDVFLSPWLIVSTFLLALVLAIGKRRNELNITTTTPKTRVVLEEYSQRNLDQLLVITMATLLMSYSLYTFSQTNYTMMITLPFAFFGVFRYHHLIHTTEIGGKPEYLLTDVPSLLNLVLWGITAIVVLYNVPELAVEVIR